MAATDEVKKVSMTIIADDGVNDDGDAIITRRTVSGINLTAKPTQIYDCAKAIQTLYTGTLTGVTTTTTKTLTESETTSE